ncbi:MAG: DUF1844 domain-containing protein [Terriglobia bacterium]
MPDEKKEPETIKITDRRRFTTEGERRPNVEASRAPEPAPPPTAAPGAESDAARRTQQAYERQSGPRPQKIDFESLVLSISTSAMYQLGLVEDPGRGRIPADLEAARHTIDMLAVIQEKTQGNLSATEQRLLEQVLYELRLSYVTLTSGQKPGAPKVGR